MSGLLQGLSQGVDSFLGSYNQEKEYQMKKEQMAQDMAIKKKLAGSQSLKDLSSFIDVTGYAPKSYAGDLGLDDSQSQQQPSNFQAPESQKPAPSAMGLMGQSQPGLVTDQNKYNNSGFTETPAPKGMVNIPGFQGKRNEGYVKDLRGEFDKAESTTSNMAQSVKGLSEGYKDPSPAGDQAILYNFIKLLNPNVPLRPGNVEDVKALEGVPGEIKHLYEKVMTGSTLSRDQREKLYKQGVSQYKGQLDLQNIRNEPLMREANIKGIDPSRLHPDYSKAMPVIGGTKPGTVAPQVEHQSALQWAQDPNSKDWDPVKAQKILEVYKKLQSNRTNNGL